MFNINYGEYVFQQLVTTEFVQRKLTFILLSIAANIINMHLASILCLIISVHPYIDFVLQICVSVGLNLYIGNIYSFLERYQPEFYKATQYLINNYSIENYRYWKRLVVITACAYLCIILLFIQITNWMLLMYITQYVICFLILEQFEQRRIQTWFEEYQTRPVAKKLVPDSDFLINSYMSPKKNILLEKPTRDKPIVRLRDSKYLIDPGCSGSITEPKMASSMPANPYYLRRRKER